MLAMAPTSKNVKAGELQKQTLHGPVRLMLIDPRNSFPAGKEIQDEDEQSLS